MKTEIIEGVKPRNRYVKWDELEVEQAVEVGLGQRFYKSRAEAYCKRRGKDYIFASKLEHKDGVARLLILRVS